MLPSGKIDNGALVLWGDAGTVPERGMRPPGPGVFAPDLWTVTAMVRPLVLPIEGAGIAIEGPPVGVLDLDRDPIGVFALDTGLGAVELVVCDLARCIEPVAGGFHLPGLGASRLTGAGADLGPVLD